MAGPKELGTVSLVLDKVVTLADALTLLNQFQLAKIQVMRVESNDTDHVDLKIGGADGESFEKYLFGYETQIIAVFAQAGFPVKKIRAKAAEEVVVSE